MCLHSGVFTRGQFCDYFGTGRPQALRFVRSLIQRREAVENRHITFSGGTKHPPPERAVGYVSTESRGCGSSRLKLSGSQPAQGLVGAVILNPSPSSSHFWLSMYLLIVSSSTAPTVAQK